MLTLRTGTLTIRTGRLTVDAVHIDEGATLHNDAEVYTRDFTSNGAIAGTGTAWAHVSSKHIGGEIAALQTVIYYGHQDVDRRFIQIQTVGYVITSPSGHGSIVS